VARSRRQMSSCGKREKHKTLLMDEKAKPIVNAI
jgi:hypothetical protein